MMLLCSLLGIVLIAIAVRDVFQTLFQPSSNSSLSWAIARLTWHGFRVVARRRRAIMALAGPMAIVFTVAVWGVLIAVGWALLYWPHLPDSFVLDPALDSSSQAGFGDALYVSLITLSTLGYGDFAPETPLLRVLAPLEAIVGFILFSAVIAWVLSLYPAIARRRALVEEASLVRAAAATTGMRVTDLDPPSAEGILEVLTSKVVAVQDDLVHFPISYYFPSREDRGTLAEALPFLLSLAEQATDDACPDGVRFRATMLCEALNDVSAVLGTEFLSEPHGSTAEVFATLARDQMWTA